MSIFLIACVLVSFTRLGICTKDATVVCTVGEHAKLVQVGRHSDQQAQDRFVTNRECGESEDAADFMQIQTSVHSQLIEEGRLSSQGFEVGGVSVEQLTNVSENRAMSLAKGKESLHQEGDFDQQCNVQKSHVSSFHFDPGAHARAVSVPGHLHFWERIHDNFCGDDKKPITLLVLGGSVEEFPWVKTLCDWIISTLPGSKCSNGAAQSVGSSGVLRWLNQSGPFNNVDIHKLRPDIILLETSVNPWIQQVDIPPLFPPNITFEALYIEQIVREVLQYDWHPMLLAFEWMCVRNSISFPPRFITNQDLHTHVYKYYGIPVVSVRDVLWPYVEGSPSYFDNINESEVNLTPSLTPSLKVEQVWNDGLHPTEDTGKIIVDVITHFLVDGLQQVHVSLKANSVHASAQLPPLLMTDGQQALMFPSDGANSTSAQQRFFGGSIQVAEGNDRANLTARATDMLTILSGCSLLIWERLNFQGSDEAFDSISRLQPPPSMPMVALSVVRLISHLHITCMHYFMLQPRGAAVLIGFPNWAQWGWCWVQFFFIVSGFVLYVSNASSTDKFEGSGFVSFFLRRIGTLYPVFLLSLVIALANPESLEFVQQSPVESLCTVFLLQTWVRPYGYVLLNGPSWYLSCLVAFYLLFPRWLQQVQRSSRPIFLLLLLWAISFVLPLASAGLSTMTGRPVEQDLDSGLMSFLQFHPLCNWHLFLFGIALARCCCDWHARVPRLLPPILGVLALVLILLIFTFKQCPVMIQQVFYDKGPILLPVYACLLTGVALTNFRLSTPLEVLSKWVAGWAWCLYILHVPLFLLFHKHFARHGISAPVNLASVAAMAALMVYVVYDQPVQWMVQRASKA